MAITDEVLKTYKMVKDAGYTIEDVIFEGAMRIKGRELLQHIDELAAKKKAMGSIKIAYSTGENQTRIIEIPIGEAFPEVGETETESSAESEEE